MSLNKDGLPSGGLVDSAVAAKIERERANKKPAKAERPKPAPKQKEE